jgi:hypothetical protein
MPEIRLFQLVDDDRRVETGRCEVAIAGRERDVADCARMAVADRRATLETIPLIREQHDPMEMRCRKVMIEILSCVPYAGGGIAGLPSKNH